jgi:hypothetical protein
MAYIEKQYGKAVVEEIEAKIYGINDSTNEALVDTLINRLGKSQKEVEELLAQVDYSKYYAPTVIAQIVDSIEKKTKINTLETTLKNLDVVIDNIDVKGMSADKWKSIAESEFWG